MYELTGLHQMLSARAIAKKIKYLGGAMSTPICSSCGSQEIRLNHFSFDMNKPLCRVYCNACHCVMTLGSDTECENCESRLECLTMPTIGLLP